MRLFVVLLSSFVGVVTAWSDCHADRDTDHRSRENCSALGLTDMPPGFDPTTQVLLFSKNQFSSLSWSTFQVFSRIYELDFRGNKILELTPSVTPILPTLSVLRLGSNRLKSLPDGAFSACPALTKVYLDNNAMDALSDHTFSGLSKLEILDLSSNRIKLLPTLMLHPLPAIETIILEHNQITGMPDDWFSQKEEVPYLYLSANPWACSCSLGYLHEYLDEFQLNVYVWNVRTDVTNDVKSVICASPPALKDKPVVVLKKSDLCPTEDPRTITPYSTPTTPDTTTTPTITTPTPSTPDTTPTTTTSYTTSTNTPDTTPKPTTPTPKPTPTTPTSITTPAVVTSTTPKLWVVTTTAVTLPSATLPSAILTPPLAAAVGGRVRGAAAFCFWLFAGGLLLSALSAVCLLATLAKTIVWYRRVYRPLSTTLARRRGGEEAVKLLTYNREVAGGGAVALYRSVLFVHREGGDTMKRGGEGGLGGEGGEERMLVTLQPTGGRGGATREEGGEGRGREEKGVYRKTLYRLSSKEEEVQGWRDVVEECRVSADERGRRQGKEGRKEANGGVSRKRYSVILREEREETGAEREELDWVVGGWEVKRGSGDEGEGPRSSWGEWLAHYLPSMPWGVTTPPEIETAV